MRIVQTSDGRYIKVLSPQLEGLIGRLYGEINERKATDTQQAGLIADQQNQITVISGQMDTMLIRYSEITDTLRKLFSVEDPTVTIDRSLVVSGSAKASTYISTEPTAPPLVIASKAFIQNLNAEFLNGNSVQDLENTMDEKVAALDQAVADAMNIERTNNSNTYAPISHVNAGGVGVHPYATQETAGFLSPADKAKLDQFVVDTIAPASPVRNTIWIDLN